MINYHSYPLKPDFERIFKTDKPEVVFKYTAVIHTADLKDKSGKVTSKASDFEPMKVISLDIRDDYTNNLGGEANLSVMVGLGDYVHRVMYHYENIEVSIYRQSFREKPSPGESRSRRLVNRYKAKLDFGVNPDYRNEGLKRLDIFDLNSKDVVTLTFALMLRDLEALLLETVTGVYTNVKADSFVRALFGARAKNLKVEGKPVLDAIDMVTPHNQDTLTQVVLPSGTRLLDIPTFLQNKAGGLYRTGVGTYLKHYKGKKTLFIYPTAGVEEGDKDPPTLLLYRLPKEQFGAVDHSYRIAGNVVHALISRDSIIAPDYSKTPNSFQSVDSASLTNKGFEATPAGPVGDPSRLMTNVAIREQPDGAPAGMYTKDRLSDNAFTALTAMEVGHGKLFVLVWDYANPDLLYPGMKTEYRMVDTDGKVKTIKGRLVVMHTVIQLPNKGLGETAYLTSVMMVIFSKYGDY